MNEIMIGILNMSNQIALLDYFKDVHSGEGF